MKEKSKWHDLKLRDRETYPQSDSWIEVRLADGSMKEGKCDDFFPPVGVLYRSQVTSWRYAKGSADSLKSLREPLNGYLLLPEEETRRAASRRESNDS